ncbi:MAG: bifunctional (p)ppGpp synthetase/guanosine-3',5'-bis(diphosphate) 3'-pyrophosphohydrolase [Ruminococcaceae bacterium]|nr:bifunctional (p)ppGpp synthetase/guanosine-3',5'-bis(diphosphate) 3'-pyrophosphohydrolase [Oscillospiraceae bacterium]
MELETKYEKNYSHLVSLMEQQDGSYDFDLVRRAFELCVNAHKGQYRKSKEEFYFHPYSVAKIIVGLGMDTESIAAALLHDVVEDTDTTIDQIKSMFGEDVALIVDGVTKIGRIQFVSREQQQAESLRKMLIAMGKDIRVIIIKLADRLHNMRTIDSLPDQKQRDKALETIEVYAPIAHRLGIRPIKDELEDLAIKHLDPIAYHEIEGLLSSKQDFRESTFKSIRARIEERLLKDMPGVEFVLQARVKSIPGIYRKMFIQGKDFDEIYDVYALRIITNTVNDCYNVLGIMHDMFRPIPNRFKDYVSTPKPNMYQSLHTTVIGREAVPFEIQIRTFDMHHTAEFGIAAHWKYKEGITTNNKQMEDRLAWIRQILENDVDSSDLIRSIKIDLSQEDVFAVTPKGDVINLPVGSTVIDFAFAIHSAVGVRMIGAKVDGKIVQINHVIKTGEVIEILTTNAAGHGPSRDWLNIAVTSSAKAKIRSWFKKERREENIETGKTALETELRRNSVVLPEKEMKDFLEEIARKQKQPSVEELYASIGYGGILLEKLIPRIKEDYAKLLKSAEKPSIEEYIKKHIVRSPEGVVIEGIDNCLVKLSKCCAPLPGDDIIGFITRGHGVSVHKRDCVNVPVKIAEASEPDRWIKAYWADSVEQSFTSTLHIDALDRDGLLAEVTNVLFNMRVGLHAVNARAVKGGHCAITVTVSAASVEHLRSIIEKLTKLSGVFSVERTNQ